MHLQLQYVIIIEMIITNGYEHILNNTFKGALHCARAGFVVYVSLT